MQRRLTAAMVLWASAAVATEARAASPPEVTAVRYWSLTDATRVAIEITGEAQIRSDRVENPDRIFFDFVGARPLIDGHRLFSKEVGDRLLKRIRVAETQPGVTRVVLDLESPAEFTVSRLQNPSRMIIELRQAGSGPAPDRIARAAEQAPELAEREGSRARHQAPLLREPPQRAVAPPPALSDPPALKPESAKKQMASLAAKVAAPAVNLPAPPPPPPPTVHRDPEPAEPQAGHARAVARAAHPAADGEHSLTRALGLKINRVVIDPGHGGSDEGTVGRRGLKEKELVLDVSRRLGKLIEDRMGSEVIFTRADDTFIPLHARTEIANQKKADLFLSIHANSSPHPKIGGIEVYYLNFTRSAEDLDVAARENASSEKSVFELRDLIQSITLHEKVEESKDFAAKVQASLQTFETRYNTVAKNRGVKKAPFVVLIGASMPSVLAEIGFLSNAREEQLLKRPEHRQRLAEALYQGVSRYAESLSHFQVAQRTAAE